MAKGLISAAGGLSAADKKTAGEWMVEGHEILRGRVAGSIPARGAATITPGTSDQTIPAGLYLSGEQTIRGDAGLIPENIRGGANIFGVTGTVRPIAGFFLVFVGWFPPTMHFFICNGCGDTYIRSGSVKNGSEGYATVSFSIVKSFAGYAGAPHTSTLSILYNGSNISIDPNNPTNFVAGTAITVRHNTVYDAVHSNYIVLS